MVFADHGPFLFNDERGLFYFTCHRTFVIMHFGCVKIHASGIMAYTKISPGDKIRPVLNLVVGGHTNISGRLSRSFSDDELEHRMSVLLRFFSEELTRMRVAIERLYDVHRPEIKIISCLATGTDEMMSKLALKRGEQFRGDESEPEVTVYGVLPEGYDCLTAVSPLVHELDDAHKLYMDCNRIGSCSLSNENQLNAVKSYCYQDANELMLMQADFAVIVWDGEPDSHIGGTYSMLLRARELKVPVILLLPEKQDSFLYLYEEKQVSVSIDGMSIHEASAQDLRMKLEKLILGGEQTLAFQRLYDEDREKNGMCSSRAMVDYYILKGACKLMGSEESRRYKITAPIIKAICSLGNKNIEFSIKETPSEKELSVKYPPSSEAFQGAFARSYTHFDSLAVHYAARHRNSMFWRFACSLLAVIALASGLSAKMVDTQYISQILSQGPSWCIGLIIFQAVLACFGVYISLFAFHPRKGGDYFWWILACVIALVCGYWCLSDGKPPWSPDPLVQRTGDELLWGGKIYMWFIFCQVMCLCAVISITRQSRNVNEHIRFYYYRVIAERCRFANYIWTFGGSCDKVRAKAHVGELNHWSNWYFRAIVRTVGLPSGRINYDDLKRNLYNINCQLSEDQRQYHKRRYHRYMILASHLFFWSLVCFALWMVASCIRSFLMGHNEGYAVVSWFALTLPAGISLMGSLIASMELFNFAQVSRHMYYAYVKLEKYIHSLIRDDVDGKSKGESLMSSLNFSCIWSVSQVVNNLYQEELSDWQRDISSKNIKIVS